MSDKEKDSESSTVVGKISGLVTLYGIFVFISGWTYLDFYYRTFGINLRWIDVSFPETMMKGFIILFEGAGWLWIIYLFVLVVPVVFEVFPRWRAHRIIQLCFAAVLLACLPFTHYIAAGVGSRDGKTNQLGGDLRSVRFKNNCGLQLAKLLFIHDGLYYLHDVHYIDPQTKVPANCLVPSDPQSVHELTILRSEDVKDLRIVEY